MMGKNVSVEMVCDKSVETPDHGWLQKVVIFGFWAFIAGFPLIPDGQPHNKIFYLTGLIALLGARRLGLAWFLRSPLTLLVIGYMLLTFLSYGWTEGGTLDGALEHAKDAFYLLTFLYVAARCAVLEADRRVAEGVLVVAAGLGAVIAIALFFLHPELSHQGRLVGWGRLDHPNVMASAMAVAAVFASALLVRSRGAWRLLWSVCLISVLAAGWLTQSRTGLLAIAVAVLVLAWLNGGRLRRFCVAAVLAAIGVWLSAQWLPEYLPRILSLSDEARMTIYTDTLLKGLEAPWLGHGAGSDYLLAEYQGSRFHPHNFLLMAFYNVGLIGVLVLLAVLGLAAHALLRGASADRWLAAAFAAGIVCMSTEAYHLIHRPGAPYLFFWLSFAWAVARERRLAAEASATASAASWRSP